MLPLSAERNALTTESAVEHIREVLGVITTPAPERPPARAQVAPIHRISKKKTLSIQEDTVSVC